MKKEEIIKIINDSLAETLEDDSISINSNMTVGDLAGWDSISKIVFIGLIEDKLSIKLSRVEILSLNKFDDFADLLLKKINN